MERKPAKVRGLDPQYVMKPNNNRARDLVDLQLIANNSEIDYAKTKATCRRLFACRKKQAWPPTIIKDGGVGYAALSKGAAGVRALPRGGRWGEAPYLAVIMGRCTLPNHE